MSDRDAVRLFLGVRISVEAAEAIAGAARAMRDTARAEGLSIRWVPPENYHITLKFLGWMSEATIAGIADEIPEALAGARAFEIATAGLGVFPKPERARVLWAGARDSNGELADLAEKVEGASERLGFAREAREFHPHVTIARFRRPASARVLLDAVSEQEFSRSLVSSVVLFESVMKSDGSEYAVRRVFPLEGTGSGEERHT